MCYVPEVGGLPCFGDSVCVWCYFVLCIHVVGCDACSVNGLWSDGCYDGCVISLRWGLYGGCITLDCKCGMGVLGKFGVMVLLYSGEILCVTRYMCLLGGCDLYGMSLITPKLSSQCL